MAAAKVIHGYRKEYEFVLAVCKRIGLDNARINSQLARNQYVPPLIVERRIADVKYQSVPFYRANELYGINPRYAVALKHDEFHRLRKNWPWMNIFFWVEWTQTTKQIRNKTYHVKPLAGVWRTSIRQMLQLIGQKKARLHLYRGKRNSSYIFNLQDFECLEQLEKPLPIDICFLDLETSGFSIRQGATILAIGAALRSGPEFYSLVRPTEKQWWAANPKALETNGLTWEALYNASPLSMVRHQFIEFLKQHEIVRGRAFFVGQYPHFDMRYLKHTMPMHLDSMNAPVDCLLDIRSVYRMLASWELVPKLEYYGGHEISKALGVPEEPTPHNALDGARAAMRNYFALDQILN